MAAELVVEFALAMVVALIYLLNSLTAKSVLAGEKLVATYSIST
jgi:hypothetical protein